MAAMRLTVVVLLAALLIDLAGCEREQKAISTDLPAARATKARADAQAIAGAVRQYQATFGALPGSIEELTEARTLSGVTAGPFLARVPTPPDGWSAYAYSKQGETGFAVTSSGGGVTVTAP
jgi:hypothetical protein